MKNKLKPIVAGCLFAVSLLLFAGSCTNQGVKPSNQKLIKAYYAAYEKKDWT